MIRRHPSRARLAAWLAGDDDARIDEHLLTCARCASICEDLDRPATDDAVGSALLQILAPPADLGSRMVDRIDEQLQSREIADYVFDLFASGLDAGRLLLLAPEPHDERPPGSTAVESVEAADQTDPDPPLQEDP